MFYAVDEGYIDHPMEVMKKIGITYKSSESVPLGDCWFFYDCSGLPEKLPLFLKFSDKKKDFDGEFLDGVYGRAYKENECRNFDKKISPDKKIYSLDRVNESNSNKNMSGQLKKSRLFINDEEVQIIPNSFKFYK